jgi:hypothetical protein
MVEKPENSKVTLEILKLNPKLFLDKDEEKVIQK